MASDHVVEEIKQRLDIVEYIGRTVELKRAGRTYKANCPFHSERTPSFVVFPHTGTWHCFGACGEGGDLFAFVQKRDGLAFPEALKLLAREAGIELEEESASAREAREGRDRLRALCDAAAAFYQQALRESPDARFCRDYIARRGLSDETVFRFGVGYAPARWDALVTAMLARGFSVQELLSVGLARARDDGSLSDWLYDRLIFPIRDERGRTIAFGGRALHDEQQPKYLNSPQTPLFDKGTTLYALDLAKDAIRLRGQAVVVEGYMDAIAAHQAGATNVVATLGTAITGDHLTLLQRYSPNLVLALDGDEAGQRAAERGLEAIRDARQSAPRRANRVEGDVRVLVLPDGMDPDDLFRRDPQRWESLVGEAQPVLDFLIGRRLLSFDPDDGVEKARAAADLLPLIAEQENSIVRGHYLQRLARLLRTDEKSLMQEMARLGRSRRRRAPSPVPPTASPPASDGWQPMDAPPPGDEWFGGDEDLVLGPPPAPPPDPAKTQVVPEAPPPPWVDSEGYLLYLMLEHPSFIPRMVAEGSRTEMWELPEYRELAATLERAAPSSAAHLEEWLEGLDPLLVRTVRRLMHRFNQQPPLPDDAWEQELLLQLDHCLIRYAERLARQYHYLLDDLQRAETPDLEQMRTVGRQLSAANQQRLQRQRTIRARLHPKPSAAP